MKKLAPNFFLTICQWNPFGEDGEESISLNDENKSLAEDNSWEKSSPPELLTLFRYLLFPMHA